MCIKALLKHLKSTLMQQLNEYEFTLPDTEIFILFFKEQY